MRPFLGLIKSEKGGFHRIEMEIFNKIKEMVKESINDKLTERKRLNGIYDEEFKKEQEKQIRIKAKKNAKERFK